METFKFENSDDLKHFFKRSNQIKQADPATQGQHQLLVQRVSSQRLN